MQLIAYLLCGENLMNTDIGNDDASLLLATSNVKTIKPAPKANRFDNCLSCETPIPHNYCPNCGQKNDDMRRSLFVLIADILGNIFAFEGRMWKTWGALLFKPGKIARTYADGNRMLYSAPIRTYLVVSILFFSFMGFSNTHFMSFEVKPIDKTTTETNSQSTLDDAQAVPKPTPNIPSSIPIGIGPDLKLKTESVDIPHFEFGDVFKPELYDTNVRFFVRDSDLYKLTDIELQEIIGTPSDGKSDDNVVKINNTTYNQNALIKTLLSNPKRFNSTFNTWLPRAMFFMVPFAMLFGWLFIRGPKALLIDHLIHAMYLQSALFIALLFTVIISQFISGSQLGLPLFGVLALYFMVSLKRMFGRGWIKTIWTTLMGGGLYLLILTLITGAITVMAFANIATAI